MFVPNSIGGSVAELCLCFLSMGKGKGLKAALIGQQSRLKAKKSSKKQGQASSGNNEEKIKKSGVLPKRVIIPFKPTDRILLIGEGNFSFARALVIDPPEDLHSLPPQNVTATAYDSEEECYQKYPDAHSIVKAVREKGVQVIFNVDGTKLEKTSALKGRKWDRIVWNFPHAGMFLSCSANCVCLKRWSRKGHNGPRQEYSFQSDVVTGVFAVSRQILARWTYTSSCQVQTTKTGSG